MSKLLIRTALSLIVAAMVVSVTAAQDTTEVALQLGWVHTSEYAGFYVAEDAGYYADANLNVELHEGGFDTDGNFIAPIHEVVSGAANFGVISSDQLLVAREDGAPVVAIGAIFQRSPVVLMSLAEKNIRQPEDLIGKSLAMDPESATGLSVVAMLNTLGIDLEQIHMVPRTDFTNAPLTSGAVDVLDGFITNQPILLEQEGYSLNLIFPSDYAIDLYTNVIFTTEQMIAEQPDVVESFLRATLSGYQTALENPQHAAELAISYNDQLQLDAETESMLRSIPLLNPYGSHLGMMDPDTWAFAVEILTDAGVLSQTVDPEAAYTLKFLDAIYANKN